jgi:uncharacterized protein YecE (DUF72 family)
MSTVSSALAEAPPLRVFAGTSGWSYPTWKPGFYPKGVPAKKFLNYYATQLSSVEVNYTFRTLPSQKQLEGWIAEVSASTHFRFSFKAPQRITHFSRLVNCDAQVAELFAALGPAANAGRLGLVLFQLPPNFKADLTKLRNFLAAPAFRVPAAPKIAFEFRHDSWFTEEAQNVLREHNAALCIAETDDLKTPELHTAVDHTCFRLRRAGGYPPEEIAAFAERFRALSKEREVYVYFKHEDEPTGALNAQAFLRALTPPEPAG